MTERADFSEDDRTAYSDGGGDPRAERAVWTPVVPIPSDAPACALKRHGRRPDSVWTYNLADGRPAFHVYRWDLPHGEKDIRPVTLCSNGSVQQWRFKGLPPPWMIYNLDCIANSPDAEVVLCEGEKAADAAQAILPSAIATTTPHGAKSANRADLSPLQGRRVLIWPDNDVSGAEYKDAFVSLLQSAGAAEIRVIDAAALSSRNPRGGAARSPVDKWDAADALAEWEDHAALRAALEELTSLITPEEDWIVNLLHALRADKRAHFHPEVIECASALDAESYEYRDLRAKIMLIAGREAGIAAWDRAVAKARRKQEREWTDKARTTWEERSRSKNAGNEADSSDAENDQRPLIRVIAGEYTAVAEESEQAILKSGLPVMRRSHQLVRPVVQEVEGARNTRTQTAGLLPLDAPITRQFMNLSARFERFDARSEDWVPTDPPKTTAELIIARTGYWPFPEVIGVVTTQTLRPNGSILDQPGYDRITRLFLSTPPPMPLIPERPTEEDAREALALLDDLLEEFPLADGPSRSVALSALITPVVRGAISTTPMHVFSAPEAGTGKSFLADVASGVASGFPCPVQAIGRTEEETEKRLVGTLISGYPMLNLDNINGDLSGDFLCQLVERPFIEVRPLGTSRKLRLEPRLTLFATGNNISLVGDIGRRCILGRLDAQMENPYERQFTLDPLAMVVRDRGRYVAAALTICRAYIVAGRPNLLPKLASFEGWSDLVRSALVWLGRADPCENTSRIRDDDPRRAQRIEVFAAWAMYLGTETEWQVAQIVEASVMQPVLRSALLAVCGRRGELDANLLGQWLKGNRDVIAGGFRLIRGGSTDKRARWTLVDVARAP